MRTRRTLSLGLTALLLLLAACNPFQSSEERVLTILYWQAPTLPGPYLAAGYKDRDAGAITLEPLASYDPGGNLVPRLAVEIPTLANGGLAADLMSITWTLREGLKWSDGSDMTAEDVVFTWRYCADEATGCIAHSAFADIASVEAVDALTVRMTFAAPTQYPYNVFVGAGSPIISSAQFAGCVGAAATSCDEQNQGPLGTGPYRIVEFTPNERAVYERNPHYRGEDPYFDRVVLKGGGDAITAARAVLETGEADYAWNLQLRPDEFTQFEGAGQGTVVSAFASDVERIVVNQTNPDPALGDDRSEYLGGRNPHPFLTFTPIARAMSMAIDRTLLADRLYGFAGGPTCNLITGPPGYVSSANDGCLDQDIEGAKRLLDESGVVDSDGDGIREHQGVPLRIVYQTSTNAVRQERRPSSATGGVRSASRPSSWTTMRACSSAATRCKARLSRTAGSSRTCRCTRPGPASILRTTCPACAASTSRRRTTTGATATSHAPAMRTTTRCTSSWRRPRSVRSARSWSSGSTTSSCSTTTRSRS